jgi:hypothetical protein
VKVSYLQTREDVMMVDGYLYPQIPSQSRQLSRQRSIRSRHPTSTARSQRLPTPLTMPTPMKLPVCAVAKLLWLDQDAYQGLENLLEYSTPLFTGFGPGKRFVERMM